MASCGCKDPLSGAICTLTDNHTSTHRDSSDPGIVIEFGDPPHSLILPQDHTGDHTP